MPPSARGPDGSWWRAGWRPRACGLRGRTWVRRRGRGTLSSARRRGGRSCRTALQQVDLSLDGCPALSVGLAVLGAQLSQSRDGLLVGRRRGGCVVGQCLDGVERLLALGLGER